MLSHTFCYKIIIAFVEREKLLLYGMQLIHIHGRIWNLYFIIISAIFTRNRCLGTVLEKQ